MDSVGFDHNGGWGKQALEVLKELFKNGDHWHSEWHRLYFRKMMVEQVSELLTEKNAQLSYGTGYIPGSSTNATALIEGAVARGGTVAAAWAVVED